MDYINSIIGPLQAFFTEVLMIIPQLIAAYIIWLVGSWAIDKLMKLVDKVDIKRMKVDDQFRAVTKGILNPVAKFILILIILDTFGIGSSIIGALASGLTYTIAIALGLAFGKALEDDARNLVNKFKSKTIDK